MSAKFPPAPPVSTPLLAARPSPQARQMLALRRSASKRHLTAPGPSGEELTDLLTVAARVPDHRRLEPWRFIVFEGEARAEFGEALARIYDKNTPDADAAAILEESTRLMRAPTVVAVISSPEPAHKTPVWEQELSVGAVCQNLLLAANASGWAGVWITEWLSYDADVDALLGLTEHERVAGYFYLGTCTLPSVERPRPDMAAKITRWIAVT